MTVDAVSAVCVLGSVGVATGGLTRRLLGTLRRGARVRAPLCELGVGVVWAAAGGLWGTGGLRTEWLPVVLGLGWLGVAAGVVDVRHRRLPDALTLPAGCVAPLVALPLGAAAVGRGLLGSLVAVLGYGAVHALRPDALGAGDVKLAASLGVVLGAASWGALAAAATLAGLFTGVAALVVVGAHRVGRRGRGVPHGPSMLAAAWLVTVSASVGWA